MYMLLFYVVPRCVYAVSDFTCIFKDTAPEETSFTEWSM